MLARRASLWLEACRADPLETGSLAGGGGAGAGDASGWGGGEENSDVRWGLQMTGRIRLENYLVIVVRAIEPDLEN